MRRVLLYSIVVSAVALIAPSLVAADVAADWTGSRSSSLASQILATDGWAGGGFQIDWVIEKPSYFTYEYTVQVATQPKLKNLSHIIIEVSDPFVVGVDAWDFKVNGVANPPADNIATTYEGGGSNPGLPTPPGLFGIKFNTSPTTDGKWVISFNSWRAPVWGDFYAKDGVDGGAPVTAWNAKFGVEPSVSAPDFNGWIARPDSRVYIPEPVFFQFGAMMGLGGIGVLRLRRKA